MMTSSQIIERLNQALIADNREKVQGIISDISHIKGKNSRGLMQCSANSSIVEYAIQKNQPELLSILPYIPPESAKDLVSQILQQCILTGDRRWLHALVKILDRLEKKSLQSQLIAKMVQSLISSGISQSEPAYIAQGLEFIPRISFRKYRSDCIIKCVPPLTVWATAHDDLAVLYRVYALLDDITDASKRTLLSSDVAQALAAVAVRKNEFPHFLESIRIAAGIPQNLKRKEGIRYCIGIGVNSGFRADLLSVTAFIRNFPSLSREVRNDLIGALTEQLLILEKDKNLVTTTLTAVYREQPSTKSIVIQNLLSEAEHSGNPWYLAEAIRYIQALPEKEKYPVREIVRSAIAVARHTRSISVLLNLIPILERKYNLEKVPGVYLQLSQAVLLLGDFENAVLIFKKSTPLAENAHQYSSCLLKLTVEYVLQDQQVSKFEGIFEGIDRTVLSSVISQAVYQIVHTLPFTDIAKHCDSFKQLVHLHPSRDSLVLDSVTYLINRGFLEACDSSNLVDLAKSIQEQSLREQAISQIVTKLAEMGVHTGDRDFLQQAVGITCLIEGQHIRSATLSSIIDDAALLAATQGDLDLLLRMRTWSGLLQDQNLVSYAMTTITEGVLKYAIHKCDPAILDEAYRIAHEIDDPSLKMRLCEQIAEAFVRIGCDRLERSVAQHHPLPAEVLLAPFENGLALLKTETQNSQISLKIAGMIDILLQSLKKDASEEYLLPLALYTLEIGNSCERDAMMSRIVANLRDDLVHPDSSDPYEVFAYLLQEHYRKTPVLCAIDLIHRLLDLTYDPFVRLRGLCLLADSAARISDHERARQILDEVYSAVPILPAEHQKIQILAGLSVGYLKIDPVKAKQCLEDSLSKLSVVEPEKEAIARRQIVMAVVGLDEILPGDSGIKLVLNIVEKLSNPEDYVKALISASSLVHEDKEICTTIIRHIYEAVEKIESPYDQVLFLLEIVPPAIKNCDEDMPLFLLKKVETRLKTINIQHISDTVRGEIARLFSVLSKKQKKTEYMKKAAALLSQIEDDELRQIRLSQIGYEDQPEKRAHFSKIVAFSLKIMNDDHQIGQIMALERAVRSLPDRGKRALLFCRLSIRFRDKGDVKLSKQMLANAVNESSIIRPLSKRAYTLCDLSMKLYAAGYERLAQDILDDAIDSATNIRQAALREEVFNELGLAIQIMQGMRE